MRKRMGMGLQRKQRFIYVQSNELGINGVNLQDQCSMSLNVVHLKTFFKYND